MQTFSAGKDLGLQEIPLLEVRVDGDRDRKLDALASRAFILIGPPGRHGYCR